MEELHYFRYILALAVVLGLIAALGWAIKKFGWAQLGIKLATPQSKRLQIVTMQALDTRHRLVLVRRDNVEHLLAIGPECITPIETGISTATSDLKNKETTL